MAIIMSKRLVEKHLQLAKRQKQCAADSAKGIKTLCDKIEEQSGQITEVKDEIGRLRVTIDELTKTIRLQQTKIDKLMERTNGTTRMSPEPQNTDNEEVADNSPYMGSVDDAEEDNSNSVVIETDNGDVCVKCKKENIIKLRICKSCILLDINVLMI
ncbi:hypothetical protein Bhyg_08703 [Pseudolycoriella hygida]|uniref:Uncharacterized protein n=1 Tax=Pseudolycoriella hygida TaxID=35572 RepID=A0A9Q0S4K7_9DIPT|nr:hypothetical protein Bhyg_08703 [Pseudolycoriella hygida]